jgi:glycosyltransferase involved in cell wall biosynthesis
MGIPTGRPIALQFLAEGTAEEALGAVRSWKRGQVPDHAVLVLAAVGREGPLENQSSACEWDAIQAVDRTVHFLQPSRESVDHLCALGWAASVVIDMSRSRWPNLHLLDAMWKETPVLVASGSPSATLIPKDAGFHVRTEEELSQKLGEILEDSEQSAKMGHAAHEAVVRQHLVPRHLLDYLKLLLYFEKDTVRA